MKSFRQDHCCLYCSKTREWQDETKKEKHHKGSTCRSEGRWKIPVCWFPSLPGGSSPNSRAPSSGHFHALFPIHFSFFSPIIILPPLKHPIPWPKLFFTVICLIFLSIFSLGKFCHWMLTFFYWTSNLLHCISSFNIWGKDPQILTPDLVFILWTLFEHSDLGSCLQWSFTSVMILTF